MMNLLQNGYLLNALFAIAAILGSALVARKAYRDEARKRDQETIQSMRARIETLEEEMNALKEQNKHLLFVQETIQDALKQRGILITISGDLVTITDASGASHSTRRVRPTPHHNAKEAP